MLQLTDKATCQNMHLTKGGFKQVLHICLTVDMHLITGIYGIRNKFTCSSCLGTFFINQSDCSELCIFSIPIPFFNLLVS